MPWRPEDDKAYERMMRNQARARRDRDETCLQNADPRRKINQDPSMLTWSECALAVVAVLLAFKGCC
jgi:hypothetical protein